MVAGLVGRCLSWGSRWVPGCSTKSSTRSTRTSRGNVADLIVLDRNPFDGPPSAIAETGVALTYVSGKRVHAAADA